MALRWEERRECFRDARRARYLARVAGKAADIIIAMSLWHIPGAAGAFAETREVDFQQAEDDVPLSD